MCVHGLRRVVHAPSIWSLLSRRETSAPSWHKSLTIQLLAECTANLARHCRCQSNRDRIADLPGDLNF